MESPAKFKPFNVLKPSAPDNASAAEETELTPIQQALRADAERREFIPVASAPTAPTIPPFPLPTEITRPRPRIETTPPFGQTDERPAPSSSAAIGRTLTLVLKLSIAASVLLGGTFLTMKTIVPVIKELSRPKSGAPAPDANAPSFVKAIQVTRQVVAKNDANVDYLNSLVDPDAPTTAKALGTSPTAAPAPAPLTPKGKSPVPGKVTAYAPSSAPEVSVASTATPVSRLALRAFDNAIAEFKIDGVVGGHAPRILIDGVLLRVGDIADHRLKLRFAGADQSRHLIFFKNEADVVFQRRY